MISSPTKTVILDFEYLRLLIEKLNDDFFSKTVLKSKILIYLRKTAIHIRELGDDYTHAIFEKETLAPFP